MINGLTSIFREYSIPFLHIQQISNRALDLPAENVSFDATVRINKYECNFGGKSFELFCFLDLKKSLCWF